MNLTYTTSTKPGSLRTIHTIVIDGQEKVSTKAKEILTFAKPRIFSKSVWKELKEAVRLGHNMTVTGGDLLS
jgi:hypothetical protein